ncbi:substrate-binding periplasmic protein [Uliginosibacterium gangwonense]|uniref:substrate-binding periplasmic protein n=1 Tax=Uliginosibacterium gangwonense TaxID=392736 RepID=UPI0003A2267D|nr:transporter substrate-binding domain-containing protein [Uliginosibacterium gangwonense]
MKFFLLLVGLVSLPAVALNLTTEEFPPYNFSGDGGKTISGISTEIVREMFKRADLPLKISLMPWERAYQTATVDKDTCVYSTSRTDAREKVFKWVGPIAVNSWAIFAKADSPINAKSLDEIKQYKVGGYRGDATAIYLKEQGIQVEEGNNDEQNARKLAAGRMELWGGSAQTIPGQAKKAGVAVKLLFTFKEAPLYLACNLAVPDADIKKLGEALKAMKSEGVMDKILKAY